MTKKIKVLIYAAVAVAISVGIATSVNVHGNIINADTGYQLAGAAPLNHFLCGNGTSYIDSSVPCGATSTMADVYVSFAGCTYPNDGANITCTNSVTLSPAMPDTSYSVSCTWSSPINPYMIFNYNISTQTTTGFVYTQLTSGSSSNFSTYGANYSLTVVCHAHHN